jgi:hypothetical protein
MLEIVGASKSHVLVITMLSTIKTTLSFLVAWEGVFVAELAKWSY